MAKRQYETSDFQELICRPFSIPESLVISKVVLWGEGIKWSQLKYI